MTQPRAEDAPARRTPPPHRGLGVLGYVLGVGLLVLAFVFLDSSATYDASLELADDTHGARTDVTVVCHSVLSGGPSGQIVDVEGGEVEEYRVDDQPGVLAECSRLRDQSIGRAVLAASGGLLWALVVTAALGWAALRRLPRPV